MIKRKISIMCQLIILFLLCLDSVSAVVAEDCGDCDKTPTFPGNASRCRCEGAPIIVATFANGMNTIDSIHPVILSANGGCPPYTLTINSSNYSLSNNGKMGSAYDTITLNASSGLCGSTYNNSNTVCTVTITDSCPINPKSSEIQIRNTSGAWIIVERISSKERRGSPCGLGGGQVCEYFPGTNAMNIIQGGEKWVITRNTCFTESCTVCPYTTNWKWNGGNHYPPCGSPGECVLANSDFTAPLCSSRVEINSMRYEYYQWRCQ
jgi:hypothetical protein